MESARITSPRSLRRGDRLPVEEVSGFGTPLPLIDGGDPGGSSMIDGGVDGERGVTSPSPN
jgi:hypothetical protein